MRLDWADAHLLVQQGCREEDDCRPREILTVRAKRDAARYEQGQPGVVGCSCVWNFAGNSDGQIDGQTGSRRSIPSFHLMWLTLSRSDQTG